MRKLNLFIHIDYFFDVAEKIVESGLENSIISTNDDNEIEVEISYSKEDSDKADEIENFLTELETEND